MHHDPQNYLQVPENIACALKMFFFFKEKRCFRETSALGRAKKTNDMTAFNCVDLLRKSHCYIFLLTYNFSSVSTSKGCSFRPDFNISPVLCVR